MIKKLLAIIAIVTALPCAGFLGFIYQVGAWNVLFPSNHHESTPPNLSLLEERPSVLLFTKTNGFRHKDAIRVGSRFFRNLSEENGWNIYTTENSAVFNPRDLAKFDVVIFHNVTGNAFSADQQNAFEDWLLAGGGWLGTHAAGDGSHFKWPWYMENLIGVTFTGHIMGPQFQSADVINEQPQHPAMANIPSQWSHEEEWYSWETSARVQGFFVLASVDETSYAPRLKLLWRDQDIRMGDHPVIWSNCIGEGKTIYSALGHSAASYENEHHIQILENALLWLLMPDDDACA